jgi:hypothetical protein
MAIGVANIGGCIKFYSNSFTLSLSLQFSSFISIMETSNASPVTLWIEDNLDGRMSLRSIVEKYFPFYSLKLFQKLISWKIYQTMHYV